MSQSRMSKVAGPLPQRKVKLSAKMKRAAKLRKRRARKAKDCRQERLFMSKADRRREQEASDLAVTMHGHAQQIGTRNERPINRETVEYCEKRLAQIEQRPVRSVETIAQGAR